MSRVGNFLSNLFSGPPPAGNQALLRAYGKLPFYAEYRRLEVAPGTATVFSQWLDAGRLAWFQSAGQNAKDAAMLPSRMIIQLPGAKEAVVTTVWDSRDNVGRIFPFAFFIVCNLESLGADVLERWASATAIFEEFEKCYNELLVLRSGGDFYKLFQKRLITIKPDNVTDRLRNLLDQASRVDAQTWFDAAGLAPASPQEWFSDLVRRGSRWNQQPEDFGRAALSCPLAGGIPCEPQAVFWLRWLDPLAKHAGKNPCIISPGQSDGKPQLLHIVIRDLLPDDFQLLTTQAAGYNFTENLSRCAPMGAKPDSVVIETPRGSLLSWFSAQALSNDRRSV